MKSSFHCCAALGLMLAATGSLRAADAEFGAYYTRLNTGAAWEAYSRTGGHADLVVRVPRAGGELVFWRGNSYLPYWQTAAGRWDFTEIVPRSGDGAEPMPDRANVYSHVALITNTLQAVVVHWRYLSRFTAGNPQGNVSPDNFVDEVLTITPDGRVERVVKPGTRTIQAWQDPLNQTTQLFQLTALGITELRRTNPRHSRTQSRVEGNPRRGPPVVQPALWFRFDEGIGDQTRESISHARLPVPGPKTYWKRGVSGTALEFDGYNTMVALPADQAPPLAGGSLTVEAWCALGAYPWNWVPLVQQGDDAGFFLGVDSHGYPGFMLEVDGVWERLTVPSRPPYADPNHLALFHWYELAGTYDRKDGRMRLFIDGKEIARKTVGRGGLQATHAEVRVGKAGVRRVPTDGTHDTLPSDFGFDGLMDEVRVYPAALRPEQLAQSFARFNPGPAIVTAPDLPPRHFPRPDTGGKFGAVYTHLTYYETWDNLFRFGAYPDVVVGFDQLPGQFVFWHGVSFVPMLVNGAHQWFTEEFNETGFNPDAPGDCEPMSDKGCYDSHVRVLENHAARVAVEWRYRLANPAHHWAFYDAATGWGDLADWVFYIYPDGVASVRMRLYTARMDFWHEWDEQIAVLSPGQRPEEVVRKTPVMTLVDRAGAASDYDWNPEPPKPRYAGNIIQMVHFTGSASPFAIQNFTGGDVYSGERTWYSVFPSWNHWPVAQIDSSGRNASFPDRASHSSISHLFWPLYREHPGKIPYQEKLLMEGMSDLPAAALTNLACSWLEPPAVLHVAGGTAQGYNQARRAYLFTAGDAPLSFQIAASETHPLNHLCLEVRHWKSRSARAALALNGGAQTPGAGFRQGVNLDTDGTCTLVVWLGLSATTPQTFELGPQ